MKESQTREGEVDMTHWYIGVFTTAVMIVSLQSQAMAEADVILGELVVLGRSMHTTGPMVS
jgi:hypothetical protein